jgi:hypothetical protein
VDQPFVHHIGNQPQQAREHFYGIGEAKPDLVGLILTDKLDKGTESTDRLPALQWRRRELENYLCLPEVLVAYARQLATEAGSGLPLLESAQTRRFVEAMQTCIADRVPPVALRERSDPWWSTMAERFNKVGLGSCRVLQECLIEFEHPVHVLARGWSALLNSK